MDPLIKGHQSNPDLNTIKPDEHWQGTPVDKNGNFVNLYHPFTPKFTDIFKWQFEKNPFKQEKKAERWKPDVLSTTDWLHSREDVMVWLGHTCFYIRLNGITLLTDPVFGNILGTKRISPFPMDPSLLINLDYILLSHDHRDHMDEKSLKLVSENNPDAVYLSGLNAEKIIHRFTKSAHIQTAGWYQQYNTKNSKITVTFVPSRHWSKRGAFDTNTRLWGGFVIEAENIRIFFSGDSGYDQHYKQIAHTFGRFDYALLGIGAYEPAWFMHANHQSPKDALQAYKDLHARYFVPMHYGTFDLSDEPMQMPILELLKEASQQNCLNNILTGNILHPDKLPQIN